MHYKYEPHRSLALQHYVHFQFGRRQIIGNVDAYLPCARDMFPTRTDLIDREILKFNLWRDRGRWNGQVSQHHSRQSSGHELADPLVRTDLHHIWSSRDETRLAARGANTHYPSAASEAALVLHDSAIKIPLYLDQRDVY